MSFRTLKFGDRTISYDTGLNLVDASGRVAATSPIVGSSTINHQSNAVNNHVKLSVSEQHLTDDGIGTSDDETGSNSSSRSSTRQNTTSNNDGLNVDNNYEENASEISSGSTEIEEDEERNELAIEDDDKTSSGGPSCASRRVIKLDMSKLLAFDEEEEDDYDDESGSNSECESDNRSDNTTSANGSSSINHSTKPNNTNSSQKNNNSSGWHRTVAKDMMANLTRKLSNTSHSSQNSDIQQNTEPNTLGDRNNIKDQNSTKSVSKLVRRHSITICESRSKATRKLSNMSVSTTYPRCDQQNNNQQQSGPFSIMPVVTAESSRKTSVASSGISSMSNSSSTGSPISRSPRSSPSRDDMMSNNAFNNVNPYQHVEDIDSIGHINQVNDALKTLSLKLDEVAHIRSVLTKAQLDGLQLDGNIRDQVEKGKICFLCMKTRFGLFSRGQKCEMCKQTVCAKCHSEMRIPTEHFTATPVFALSPTTNYSTTCDNNQYKSMTNGSTMQSLQYQKAHPPQFTSLCVTNYQKSIMPPSVQREKKISLPASLGLLGSQSVGSAPSSPTLSRSPSSWTEGGETENKFNFPTSAHQMSTDNNSVHRPNIHTIFGSISGSSSVNNNPYSNSVSFGSSTPVVTLRNKKSRDNSDNISKYATLPRKSRRMSWNPLAARDLERERLEGSLLTVCSECKDMVVQVIRVSRTNKRSSHGRSMLFSLTPDIHRELQRA